MAAGKHIFQNTVRLASLHEGVGIGYLCFFLCEDYFFILSHCVTDAFITDL